MFKNTQGIILTGLMVLICFISKAQLIPNGKTAVKTQLHVHALTNHNGAKQQASMQWQNFQADTFNTPVIWWAEHYELLKQNENIYFIFKNGIIDTARNITGLAGNSGLPKNWDASYSAPLSNTILSDSSITISLPATAGIVGTKYISYKPRTEDDLLHTCDKFIKPITSLPVFEFYLTPQNLKNNATAIRLVFKLSWHNHGAQTQDKLVINFVDSSVAASTFLAGPDSVVVNFPVFNNVAQKITLPIANYCKLFTDSIDNVIQDYELIVQSRKGKFVSAKFDKMKIYTQDPTDQLNFQNVVSLLNRYTTLYNKKNYFGIEFTGSHGNYDHLTAYLPKANLVYTDIIAPGISTTDHQGYSDFIHNNGGLMAYTHPFGSGSGNNHAQGIQNYRLDTLYTYLVNNRLFDCDLLEVGYKSRGSADLAHHVTLWDRLTARGIYLYGIGTSDRHGDTWGGRYISWIWSAYKSQSSLISNMKKGRIYFGVTNKWEGDFNFIVGAQSMGDRVTGFYKKQYLKAYMNPVVPGMKLKLTQCKIDSTSNVLTYIVKDSIINSNDSVAMDLTQPSFIRLSVYDSNNEAFLFSNPIIYTTAGTNEANSNFKQELRSEAQCLAIKVQPNPFETVLQLTTRTCSYGKLKIEIQNLNGQTIKVLHDDDVPSGDLKFEFQLNDLPKGSYLVKAYTEDEISTDKIIKN